MKKKNKALSAEEMEMEMATSDEPVKATTQHMQYVGPYYKTALVLSDGSKITPKEWGPGEIKSAIKKRPALEKYFS